MHCKMMSKQHQKRTVSTCNQNKTNTVRARSAGLESEFHQILLLHLKDVPWTTSPSSMSWTSLLRERGSASTMLSGIELKNERIVNEKQVEDERNEIFKIPPRGMHVTPTTRRLLAQMSAMWRTFLSGFEEKQRTR